MWINTLKYNFNIQFKKLIINLIWKIILNNLFTTIKLYKLWNILLAVNLLLFLWFLKYSCLWVCCYASELCHAIKGTEASSHKRHLHQLASDRSILSSVLRLIDVEGSSLLIKSCWVKLFHCSLEAFQTRNKTTIDVKILPNINFRITFYFNYYIENYQ